MSSVTTIQGDTWDILAKRIWGEEKMMNELIQANPDHRYAAVFPAGVVLVVPDVSVEPVSVPPPWRQ